MFMPALAVSLVAVAAVTAQEPEKPAVNAEPWQQAIRLGGASGRYQGRGVTLRRRAAEAAAIGAGLDWLQNAQHADGCWNLDGPRDITAAVTGLATLAMLGDGSTMRSGDYKQSIKRAVKWLREQQAENGAFAGATGPHLLAAAAMTEAYLLSNYRLIERNATRGLAFAATRRDPDGGWRASETAELSDPALTVWGTTLMVAAVDARLQKPEAAFAGIGEWLQGPRATLAPHSGVLGAPVPAVRQADLAADQAMANALTRCWIEAGAAAVLPAAIARARSTAREWKSGVGRKLSMHEWYCSSYVLARAGDVAALQVIGKALALAQVTAGADVGSWQPIGAWGDVGGRAWTTAMAVLALEAPYRFTYR